MAAMSEYVMEVGGIEHTFLLSDEDRQRAEDSGAKIKAAPKNKAVTPSNKE